MFSEDFGRSLHDSITFKAFLCIVFFQRSLIGLRFLVLIRPRFIAEATDEGTQGTQNPKLENPKRAEKTDVQDCRRFVVEIDISEGSPQLISLNSFSMVGEPVRNGSTALPCS